MLRSTMTSPEMTLAAAASSLSETCSLLPPIKPRHGATAGIHKQYKLPRCAAIAGDI